MSHFSVISSAKNDDVICEQPLTPEDYMACQFNFYPWCPNETVPVVMSEKEKRKEKKKQRKKLRKMLKKMNRKD